MKHKAVVVQRTEPNMMNTFISMSAVSLTASAGTQICNSILVSQTTTAQTIPQNQRLTVAILASEQAQANES
jgi:hypothetical protein